MRPLDVLSPESELRDTDKELEAEKLQKEQKIKVKTVLWGEFISHSGVFIAVLQ